MLRTFRVADGAPLLSIPAHGDYINALRYSPDGTRIATGSADHMVKLWNSTNGDPAGTLVGHTDNVTSLAFSANGTLLASGSTDNTVKIWTTSTGTLLATLSQPTDVNSVSFNAATNRLAVVCDSDLREWDVPSQTLVRSLTRASNQISGTVFTPDSTKMVSGSYDGKVCVHDVVTGALLRQMVPGGNAFAVAASADMVAVGINVPNVVKLYRLSDGAFLRTLVPPGSLPYTYATVFSPDGATLATGHFNQVGAAVECVGRIVAANLDRPIGSGQRRRLHLKWIAGAGCFVGRLCPRLGRRRHVDQEHGTRRAGAFVGGDFAR